VLNAILGGVDFLEHAHGIDDAVREKIVADRLTVIPTITLSYIQMTEGATYGLPQHEIDISRAHYEQQMEDFRKSLDAGVRFALGSDLIGPSIAPHWKAAKEFELVVQAGMSPMDAIVAGTKVGAEVLGLDTNIGTIEPGKHADIVAVEGDPIRDIRVLQNVSFVMKAGIVVKNV
jgi:imidazolonepropionase-like amidohydrolase